MNPNFELIAHMLGDYYDLQADGIVDAANRFPLGAIEEQLALLGQLELAGNAVLANRIVDLTKERASLATQRDGLIDELNKTQDEVVDIKAQRNALAATVEALREAYAAYVESGFDEILEDAFAATPQQHLLERDAQKGRAGFVAGATDAVAYIAKQLQLGVTDINLELAPPADRYAETIRQGGAE